MVHKKIRNLMESLAFFKKTDKMRKRQMNEYAESMNNYVLIL